MARIALFDDDEQVRVTLSRMLEKAGFDVISFEDGAPALTMDFSAVDLAIIDFYMPTPGHKVIKELRRKGLTLPIIAISGLLGVGDREMREDVGANCVMTKPIGFDELVAEIGALLSES